MYDHVYLWDDIICEMHDEYLNKEHNYPWVIGFSGGKDSTLVVHAVFNMLMCLRPSFRKRQVHVLYNDTLVESPLIIEHLKKVSALISDASSKLGLPITVARTTPYPDQTFWVLLIGKGYPSPNMKMRWCTDRLKIKPTSRYVKAQVLENNAAIIVLGVRKDESQSRRKSIEKRTEIYGSRLVHHSDLPGAYIYRPIMNMSTDEVWEVLGTYDAPWGGTHRDLIQLYRDSQGGECPIVLSKADVPSCGTTSSRFGCWTCTVVDKDKSLQGFVGSGKSQYSILIDFRDWLKEIRNDMSLRQGLRRNGKMSFSSSGKHIPGPFTVRARKMILERLLETQDIYGDSLVTMEEIDIIKRCWLQDLTLGEQ
ncbi:MAG: DNA phosphorothioation system sulfurtransferase DndC [Nitrospirae bacterium]|nr:DNA phosphorothioation system sulfurtransferase DndC [Nitrospirota bacterium]